MISQDTKSSVVATQHRLLEVLRHVVDGLSATSPRARQAAFAQARELLDQPLPAVGWTAERRAALSAKVKGRPQVLLYLWTAADQPPARVSYAEAAQQLDLAVSSLRSLISAGGGAHAAKRRGQVVVVGRAETSLDLALRAKYERTGRPEDLLELPASAGRY